MIEQSEETMIEQSEETMMDQGEETMKPKVVETFRPVTLRCGQFLAKYNKDSNKHKRRLI